MTKVANKLSTDSSGSANSFVKLRSKPGNATLLRRCTYLFAALIAIWETDKEKRHLTYWTKVTGGKTTFFEAIFHLYQKLMNTNWLSKSLYQKLILLLNNSSTPAFPCYLFNPSPSFQTVNLYWGLQLCTYYLNTVLGLVCTLMNNY